MLYTRLFSGKAGFFMQQRILLSDAVDLFYLDIKSRRFTKDTQRFYRERLSLFLPWCKTNGIEVLQDLTHIHIRRYLVSLQERGLSSAYQHNNARALRAFLNYCVRDELIAKTPFAKVEMPKLAKKILPALTADEVQHILDSCKNERDEALILFLLDSGVRASELVALNVGDVDIATGSVVVHQGKGQKDRVTYIGVKTRKQLKRYLIERGGLANGEPLFSSEMGTGRLTYFGVAQLMKRLRAASGIKLCNAHTFRRTFAINCLRNGMDIFILAKLMGHADLTVLRQYLAIVKDDLQHAHGEHGVVDNLL